MNKHLAYKVTTDMFYEITCSYTDSEIWLGLSLIWVLRCVSNAMIL